MSAPLNTAIQFVFKHTTNLNRMTKLLAQAINLKNELGLEDDKIRVIEQAMKDFAVDTLNVAKHLIEKRETPATVRKFLEPHGVSYDGTSKLFK